METPLKETKAVETEAVETAKPKRTRKKRTPKTKVVEAQTQDPIAEVEQGNELVREAKSMSQATTYKVIWKGAEFWHTKDQILTAIARNMIDYVIPEGSPFNAPTTERCTNC